MAGAGACEAADVDWVAEQTTLRLRRAVGTLDACRKRAARNLHDHHHGAERTHAIHSQSHAGHSRSHVLRPMARPDFPASGTAQSPASSVSERGANGPILCVRLSTTPVTMLRNVLSQSPNGPCALVRFPPTI